MHLRGGKASPLVTGTMPSNTLHDTASAVCVASSVTVMTVTPEPLTPPSTMARVRSPMGRTTSPSGSKKYRVVGMPSTLL